MSNYRRQFFKALALYILVPFLSGLYQVFEGRMFLGLVVPAYFIAMFYLTANLIWLALRLDGSEVGWAGKSLLAFLPVCCAAFIAATIGYPRMAGMYVGGAWKLARGEARYEMMLDKIASGKVDATYSTMRFDDYKSDDDPSFHILRRAPAKVVFDENADAYGVQGIYYDPEFFEKQSGHFVDLSAAEPGAKDAEGNPRILQCFALWREFGICEFSPSR